MPNTYKKILKERNSVLVHCSSFLQLVGDANTVLLGPFDKIRFVIENDCAISCSTITAGDQPLDNYTGHVGVILEPRISSSIIHASSLDAGSSPSIREDMRKRNCIASTSDLDNAIKNKFYYNEIFLHSYRVLGLFFTRPIQFMINGNIKVFTDKELYENFPSCNFYECKNGSFQKAIFDINRQAFIIGNILTAFDIYN